MKINVIAVCFTALLCASTCLARPGHGGCGPRPGGGGCGPRPGGWCRPGGGWHHPGGGYRPGGWHHPPPPPCHRWYGGGFWPGFVGGVVGGAIASTVIERDTVVVTQPTVVQQPVVVQQQPVVVQQQQVVVQQQPLARNVWVEGRYVDQLQADGTTVRVWQPGHYEQTVVQ